MTKEEILKLREQGKTYREIGDIFGVSRQRVFAKLGKDRIRKCNFEIEKIRFKGVYEFFQKHPTLTMRRFIAHMKNSGASYLNYNEYEKLRGLFVEGRNAAVKLSDIKRLIKYTGMSFEELFEEREIEDREGAESNDTLQHMSQTN